MRYCYRSKGTFYAGLASSNRCSSYLHDTSSHSESPQAPWMCGARNHVESTNTDTAISVLWAWFYPPPAKLRVLRGCEVIFASERDSRNSVRVLLVAFCIFILFFKLSSGCCSSPGHSMSFFRLEATSEATQNKVQVSARLNVFIRVSDGRLLEIAMHLGIFQHSAWLGESSRRVFF